MVEACRKFLHWPKFGNSTGQSAVNRYVRHMPNILQAGFPKKNIYYTW